MKRLLFIIISLAIIITTSISGILVYNYKYRKVIITPIGKEVYFTNKYPYGAKTCVPAAYTSYNNVILGAFRIKGKSNKQSYFLYKTSLADSGLIIAKEWRSDYGFEQHTLVNKGRAYRFSKDPNRRFRRALCCKRNNMSDISFNIFIPHNATMSLHVGAINHNDKDIVYATQAADVRADNGGIVGAFVLKGKPLAWGLSKKGYCASIEGNVTVGVAENSPLFEEATEKGGYFFRQYPLVKDGRPIHNELRGKSVRRAICDRNGEIFMVATSTSESFHDFIQALVDLRVDQAVYLVGSTAIGWAVEEDGTLHEWGNKITDLRYSRNRSSTRSMPRNTSYIVWNKQ